jgi:dihydrofolate reductase
VFSKTLTSVTTERTTLERDLDPDAIRQLKQSADADVSIGGADLAGQALAAGLVDEIHLVAAPVSVGGGKPALPRDVQVRLRLLDTRAFASGFVHLHYAVDG